MGQNPDAVAGSDRTMSRRPDRAGVAQEGFHQDSRPADENGRLPGDDLRSGRAVVDADDEHPAGRPSNDERQRAGNVHLGGLHRIDFGIEGHLNEEIAMPSMPIANRGAAHAASKSWISCIWFATDI
ncbi:protein of unknown function [Methylorubrum extorquens DM4]|uniref:Uncharacterized protein n=1 Tax=Methylorubrum extorquens (strain DSM 6343 / CIP 106787 / DM4) TaxID=661410 RepID=A0A2P9HAP9_METED|nr:protein of unknown function [Methylorubrum extorquens DM4]